MLPNVRYRVMVLKAVGDESDARKTEGFACQRNLLDRDGQDALSQW
jgi:hypothetical protein